ncbi:MAG: hypothetical protein ACOC6H_04310 [Thermoproteota archaeon]
MEGWIVIPRNLGVGDTFYDCSKPCNVTVEGEEQKVVAGTSRTITHACDSIRTVKKWDKATGVFTYSEERPRNLTVISRAIATNLWNPQILELNQTMFYALVASNILLTLSSVIFVSRKRVNRLTFPGLSKGKIAVLTIFLTILVQFGALAFFPFFEVGLSFAEINLVIQTFWTALVLVSMWFRSKGRYFAHEITMLIVMSGSLVNFSVVLLMSPLSSGSLQVYLSSPLRLITTLLHSILSIPALFFGLWLVVLWRPDSPSFATKSRRIAQITVVTWVLSYVAGVLSFVTLHTTLLG